jgi:hypothetical protein
MNQNILYIAVVVVAAVVIVVGLFLTGAGQSGPLSGEIGGGPIPTSLPLGVTVLGEGP